MKVSGVVHQVAVQVEVRSSCITAAGTAYLIKVGGGFFFQAVDLDIEVIAGLYLITQRTVVLKSVLPNLPSAYPAGRVFSSAERRKRMIIPNKIRRKKYLFIFIAWRVFDAFWHFRANVVDFL